MDSIRIQNSTRIGNLFQSGSGVYAVSVNTVLVKNDVAHINSDAKFDLPVLLNVGVTTGRAALDFHRT
jgi:hypothetical protein